MCKPKPTTPRRGRPPTGRAPLVKINVMLPPAWLPELVATGGGNLSAGVRACIEAKLEKEGTAK